MDDILTGKICPYCGKTPKLLLSSLGVYSKDYGPIYRCEPCDAHVGCHKGTTRALGRLANRELRARKKEAHSIFDPLWQRAIDLGRSKSKARSAAYKWLAKEMNIPYRTCHIGMFNVDQCLEVISICKKVYDRSK